MAGKLFEVKDICEILRACKDSGVTRAQFGGFKVSFLPPAPKMQEVIAPTPEQQKATEAYQSDVFAQNEKRIRMEQLSQLRLSDPEAYEELQSRGELEDAGEESNGVDT